MSNSLIKKNIFQKYYILISKREIKSITSLEQKKYRDKTGLFVAEGAKVISELKNNGLKLNAFYTTEPIEKPTKNEFQINAQELQKISFLKTPNTCLAVFEIPKPLKSFSKGLQVALDGVRDPGNLGTIIRLCDWFGVETLLCSGDTADCYSPKVVQASMGSLARVQVSYLNLAEFLQNCDLPIYGGCMDSASLYAKKLPKDAILVMGNEANGITKEIMDLLTHKISIPRFGKLQKTESLNVATATAILLSEFKRPTGK